MYSNIVIVFILWQGSIELSEVASSLAPCRLSIWAIPALWMWYFQPQKNLNLNSVTMYKECIYYQYIKSSAYISLNSYIESRHQKNIFLIYFKREKNSCFMDVTIEGCMFFRDSMLCRISVNWNVQTRSNNTQQMEMEWLFIEH